MTDKMCCNRFDTFRIHLVVCIEKCDDVGCCHAPSNIASSSCKENWFFTHDRPPGQARVTSRDGPRRRQAPTPVPSLEKSQRGTSTLAVGPRCRMLPRLDLAASKCVASPIESQAPRAASGAKLRARDVRCPCNRDEPGPSRGAPPRPGAALVAPPVPAPAQGRRVGGVRRLMR